MARVLVLSPHPDDESSGCGGTLSSHVAAGDAVRVVFLTSGELGGHGISPEATREKREQEATAACAILGCERFEFWRAPDGRLRAESALVERTANYLLEWRPDLVYTTHPGEMHPDHRAAARIVSLAIAKLPAAAAPLVFLFEIWTPLSKLDRIVDITRWMEQKLRAIRAYESQCAAVRFDDAIAGLNRYRGEMHSWPEGDYAEVFTQMKR